MPTKSRKRKYNNDSSINPIIGAAGGVMLGSLLGPGGAAIGGVAGFIISLVTQKPDQN